MIMLKSTHIKEIVEMNKLHNIDLEAKSTIINHKNNEIDDLSNQYELERENANSLFEANKKLIQELSKIRKENKGLKNKCNRLENKTKYKGVK